MGNKHVEPDRIAFYVTPELKRKVKIAAASQRKTMTEIIIGLLEENLEPQKQL